MAKLRIALKALNLPKKPISVAIEKGMLVFEVEAKHDYNCSVVQTYEAGTRFNKFEYRQEQIHKEE